MAGRTLDPARWSAAGRIGIIGGAAFWLDLKIVVLTVFRMLFDRNAS
jgi:hypothetical protein